MISKRGKSMPEFRIYQPRDRHKEYQVTLGIMLFDFRSGSDLNMP